MPLNRQWVYPSEGASTTVTSNTVTVVAPTGTSGFILNADGFSSPNIVTAPANAASVYAPASYTATTASVATVVQNTLGYDANFVAYFQGAASVATFQIGTGATSPPPTTTVATSITSATTQTWDFPAYVPAGYYYSFQVSQANAASVPSAALTIVAYPV